MYYIFRGRHYNLFLVLSMKNILNFRGGKCNWRSPTEEKCIIVHKDYGDLSNCMDGASASWSPYGKGNCTITITSDVVERNGDWQVKFK